MPTSALDSASPSFVRGQADKLLTPERLSALIREARAAVVCVVVIDSGIGIARQHGVYDAQIIEVATSGLIAY